MENGNQTTVDLVYGTDSFWMKISNNAMTNIGVDLGCKPSKNGNFKKLSRIHMIATIYIFWTIAII